MNKDNLSPAKKALLEKLLQGKTVIKKEQSIPKRPDAAQIKLSHSQQRQLFLELLDAGSPVNNLSALLRLSGPLNINALESSANEIIRRHEVLRTRFLFDMGLPSAELVDQITLKIDLVDVSQMEEFKKDKEARILAEKDVLIPFNIREAPLIRLKVYKLAEDHYFFLFVVHHTIGDGWSLGVFLNELMTLYKKNTIDKSNILTELPLQYYDYAAWQTNDKRIEELSDSLAYWKDQLKGELPILELPTDENRGTRQSYNGKTHRFTIPKKLAKEIESLGRNEDVTLFMSLISAFYVVLHRYSNQEEILIGAPIANRHQTELEPMIGMFINVLALRVEIDSNENFLSLLKKVRKVATDAFTHQNVPFEKLVEELKPKRDLSRTPIFQVMFNLQNSPLPKFEVPNMEASFLELNRGVSEFDMTLMINKSENEYLASVEYNSDLFHSQTIIRIFDSYLQILESIVKDPTLPISDLKMVPNDLWNSLLQDFNQTSFVIPENKCVHHLFEQQVNQTPSNTALIFDNTELSYEELNTQSNKLAHHLKELGIKPKDRIGVLLERSVETVITLMAILKIGGNYVPVHTSTPFKRLAYIIEDANLSALITNLDRVKNESHDVQIVDPTSDIVTSSKFDQNLNLELKANDLAYTIYTSGSTGNPKGVMVSHKAFVNLLSSLTKKPGIIEADKLLAVTSISFDISGLELFSPLINGATVIIASQDDVMNPLKLIDLLEKHDISIMQATPATWQLLIDSDWQGKKNLKVLCGGESLSRKLANNLIKKVNSVWNMYGPTETTIWSSCAKIKHADYPITIGNPIGNTQLYVLDRNRKPTPIGVVGELYIGGNGLALGYLNNPILTEEKFVSNPFKLNEKIYKTGDKVRFINSSEIEFIGRLDDQVKINGYRIELGEITETLNNHNQIRSSYIIANKGKTDEKYLVAYYTSIDNTPLEISEMRSHLKYLLPSYMLPSYFVHIHSFPLSSSGKIDRKQLPSPTQEKQDSQYQSPQSETQQILVEIWQNVLGITNIGINDNFFDLGGASIQSIQVVAKANMYGYKIGVEHIFEHQSVEELANYIDSTTF